MEQSVVVLVRPKLNLSQSENQILHLIEHVLVSPERQKAIGLDEKKFASDIFFGGGYISELYCVEYYVVRSEKASSIKKIILSSNNNLCLDKVNLPSMKKVLIQELEEEKNQEISISEQFEKAIYQQKSPALRQPWFDTTKLTDLDTTKINLDKVFKKFNQSVLLFDLSFNKYKISNKIAIDKNVLVKNIGTIHLTHPYQSLETASIEILIPVNLNPASFVDFVIYRSLLSDYYFGTLYKKMRQNGLVYDLSVNYNMYANAIGISFSSSKNKASDALDFVKKFMGKDQIMSNAELVLIKKKIITDYELDWGNVSDNALYYIEEALLGEFYLSPRERIEKIKRITTREINNFHRSIQNMLEKNSIITVLNYGKKVGKTLDK